MFMFRFGCLLYALAVNAHMELIQPLPFRSKHDPLNVDIDWSMTNPLLADGMFSSFLNRFMLTRPSRNGFSLQRVPSTGSWQTDGKLHGRECLLSGLGWNSHP
jgi:hypothetical protein